MVLRSSGPTTRKRLGLLNRRARDQRGAILPMVALLLAVLVPSSAIAVDLGMQRVVRRDMQALADVVALDTVRLLDGRTAAQIQVGYGGQPTLANAVQRSVARNADTVLGHEPVVSATLVHLNTATGELDRLSGGVVREVTGSEVPNAVQITARGAVDFAFAPGSGVAVRGAVATAASSACFRIGSYAVGVDTDQAEFLNALLPALLNTTAINGTLAGYQGLAATNVTLLDLVGVPSLGVGTPDELLALEGITLNEFYAAVATVLQRNGGPAVALTLLQTLSTNANLTETIAIADLLGITTAGAAALAAGFNVLDLVTGAAYLANGDNTLLVPGLAVALPVLNTGAQVSLKVMETPRPACGEVGAKASTGQIDLTVNGTLADMNLNLLLGQFHVSTAVQTHILLAAAEGELTNIVCGAATLPATAEGIDVQVSSGLVSTVTVSAPIRITATLVIPLVGTVEVDLTVTATLGTTNGMSPGTVSFRHPPDAYGAAKRFGSAAVLPSFATPSLPVGVKVKLTTILGTTQVDLSAISGLLGALTSVVGSAVGTLNSALVPQLNGLLSTLTDGLGVSLGGADVFAMPRPTCADSKLVG